MWICEPDRRNKAALFDVPGKVRTLPCSIHSDLTKTLDKIATKSNPLSSRKPNVQYPMTGLAEANITFISHCFAKQHLEFVKAFRKPH